MKPLKSALLVLLFLVGCSKQEIQPARENQSSEDKTIVEPVYKPIVFEEVKPPCPKCENGELDVEEIPLTEWEVVEQQFCDYFPWGFDLIKVRTVKTISECDKCDYVDEVEEEKRITECHGYYQMDE